MAAALALSIIAQDDECGVSRSCLGFDVSEVGPTPFGHGVDIGVNQNDLDALREHLLRKGLSAFKELCVRGDGTVPNGCAETRIVLLTGPKDGLTFALAHFNSHAGFDIRMVTEGGAESISAPGGA